MSKKNLLTKKITKKKFFPTKKIPNFRRLKILNITIKIKIKKIKKRQEKKTVGTQTQTQIQEDDVIFIRKVPSHPRG